MPLQSKLFKYLKETCKKEFVLFHTINRKIRMKKFAKKSSQMLAENEKDEGVGKRVYTSSPDDLFKHGIELNFQQLNNKPLLCNYFTSVPRGEATVPWPPSDSKNEKL